MNDRSDTEENMAFDPDKLKTYTELKGLVEQASDALRTGVTGSLKVALEEKGLQSQMAATLTDVMTRLEAVKGELAVQQDNGPTVSAKQSTTSQ